MSTNPFDWVKSINETKENLLETSNPKDYKPFIVNKALSHHLDTLLFSNEMNLRHFLDKDIQYSFLLNSIRKRKRYNFWAKKKKLEDIEYVKKYYNYSDSKAYQALQILTNEQITYIKNKLDFNN